MLKEYDPNGDQYVSTTGSGTVVFKEVLYAGVTWTAPVLTPEAQLRGYEVVLYTGSNPDTLANRQSDVVAINDPAATDAALRIASAEGSAITGVHAAVRAVYQYGRSAWAPSSGTSTITLGTILSASLPNQSGHAGEFLETNGTSPSWAPVSQVPTTSGHSNGEVLQIAAGVPAWGASSGSGAGSLIIYGNGQDGNLAGGAGTTTLVRDMAWNNVTLTPGDKIICNGFRWLAKGTFDISTADSGAVQWRGGNGSNATTSTGATGGLTIKDSLGNNSTLAGALASAVNEFSGANGSTGNGGSGVTTTITGVFWNGGKGGSGGDGGTDPPNSPVGGPGGFPASAANPATVGYLTPYLVMPLGTLGANDFQVRPIGGGGSGGGGGGGCGSGFGDVGGGGGGGGAGSGVVFFAARIIDRGTNTNTSIITVAGGNGGNGANFTAAQAAGGGGGGGGGGGWLVFAYDTLLGSTIANAVDVSGGAGGNGGNGNGTGNGGKGGYAGGSGTLAMYDTNAGTVTTSVPTNPVAGGSNSGTTGGTGATNLVRFSL